jgi:hypothetical protein
MSERPASRPSPEQQARWTGLLRSRRPPSPPKTLPRHLSWRTASPSPAAPTTRPPKRTLLTTVPLASTSYTSFNLRLSRARDRRYRCPPPQPRGPGPRPQGQGPSPTRRRLSRSPPTQGASRAWWWCGNQACGRALGQELDHCTRCGTARPA